MSCNQTAPKRPDIWLVFSGKTELWYLRWLKPRFRHCFALIRDPGGWLLFEPLASHLELRSLTGFTADQDVPGWYRDQGLIVRRVEPYLPVPRAAPFALFTCVEAIKRLIGLRVRRVLTPWQLYRLLEAEGRFQPVREGLRPLSPAAQPTSPSPLSLIRPKHSPEKGASAHG